VSIVARLALMLAPLERASAPRSARGALARLVAARRAPSPFAVMDAARNRPSAQRHANSHASDLDHGTLVLAEAEGGALPGVAWDPRVALFRASARHYGEIVSELDSLGIAYATRSA
jgi:hypothetical protein